MDATNLYLHPPHPVEPTTRRDFSGDVKHTTRTRKPVKYYLIDFGLSRRYNPEDRPVLELPGWGGDKSVPEFLKSNDDPCDPFPVDVYCLGNVIRRNFTEVRQAFLFFIANSYILGVYAHHRKAWFRVYRGPCGRYGSR